MKAKRIPENKCVPNNPWRNAFVFRNSIENSEIKERIKKRYETKRIKIEKLLTLGYTTSGDPWKIGTK